MAEAELWALYSTHPQEMNGASRMKRHENLHRQITAFEKLLQYAMSRFSIETLYRMLQILSNREYVSETTQKNRFFTRAAAHVKNGGRIEITSLGKLREVLGKFSNKIGTKKMKSEEEQNVIKYFSTFLNDIEYLRKLKKYFDERVYMCLYDYFYDPDIESQLDRSSLTPRDLKVIKQSKHVSFDDADDSGHCSTADEAEDEQVVPLDREESQDVTELNDQEKFVHAVKRLYEINNAWSILLKESNINDDIFDEESHYEIQPFIKCGAFENVFRLVPDIFSKCHKSAEMAKLWWTQANKLYRELPDGKVKPKDMRGRVNVVEIGIQHLTQSIQTEENLLSFLKKDAASLQAREKRFDDLRRRFDEVEVRMNSTGRKYQSVLLQRESLLKKMEASPLGSRVRAVLENKLEELEWKLCEYNDTLKIREFEHSLVKHDYLIELENQPHFIRYQAHLDCKISEVEKSLEDKKAQKRKRVKELALLRTNGEKMRDVMKRYIRDDDDLVMTSGENGDNPVISAPSNLGTATNATVRVKMQGPSAPQQTGRADSDPDDFDIKVVSISYNLPNTPDSGSLGDTNDSDPETVTNSTSNQSLRKSQTTSRNKNISRKIDPSLNVKQQKTKALRRLKSREQDNTFLKEPKKRGTNLSKNTPSKGISRRFERKDNRGGAPTKIPHPRGTTQTSTGAR
ncbi:uncharacterized protein LOC106154720 [Lingula anatina]|uniref:Uncharacterized protein LOC106154720 n=1 Tax=Lingula anatina TaxID=7574 RepID=A0A1S3HGM9_LINAN|nr:uncharacterized protein LOC106154720 [Lingula anatina]|eukprot:XP_013384631.1 uncharacterized protein LOC106154720 [Lingula anatina]